MVIWTLGNVFIFQNEKSVQNIKQKSIWYIYDTLKKDAGIPPYLTNDYKTVYATNYLF